MAAASGLSKAEYLRRRYLGGEECSEAGKRRRKKQKQQEPSVGKQPRTGGMRIVDDDDTSWKTIPIEKEDEEGDDGDLPVVAEFIDERPDEVKWMEEFRTSNKWKLLGDQNDNSHSASISGVEKSSSSSEGLRQNKTKRSLDQSPPRRACRNLPDLSPKRLHSETDKHNSRTSHGGQQGCFSGKSSTRGRHSDSDAQLLLPEKQLLIPEGRKKQSNVGDSAAKKQLHSTESSPRKRQRHDSESESDVPSLKSARVSSDSDLSPPRAPRSTYSDDLSGLSPPRRNQRLSSDSDLSPPRRSQETRKAACKSRSPPDLSPPRRTKSVKDRGESQKGPQMLSGGKSGLVSAELLRREQQELRRQDASGKHLEAESQHAETVFRDKSGRKRDLKQERLEQRRKGEEKSERDEQYAKWGKGLAQSRQQQQNVEDAAKEMEKPLARYIDDQDLDKMLREQEREGDPMADFFRKKKDKEKKEAKEKPRYKGPAPPLNRFNIWPGYRWDGVDRSNGFEQKRFARIANKRAVQEMAYKWSVEDM